jgi:hypothetical protein
MATQSITQDQILANLPAPIRQAIEAARTLRPQVNGRYESAVQLVATGGVRHNPDGSYDVISRSGGARHHLNGTSCDCQDAQHRAPEIAGRRACAHQVAVWIVAKAAILARPETTAPPAPEPTQPTTAPAPVAPASDGLPCLSLAGLLAAAATDQNTEYELVTTHMGGHGYVNILRATEDPEHHESYLVGGDWKQDRLHVCRWSDHFGQPDYYTTRRLMQLQPAVTPSLTIDAGDPRGLVPASAYYLEASEDRVKVMLTHGETNPRPIRTFSGHDRLEEARTFARIRAEAQLRGLRQATPAGRFAVAHALLPEAWRQRMGGFQVGKAWVVYAEPVEQPEVDHA